MKGLIKVAAVMLISMSAFAYAKSEYVWLPTGHQSEVVEHGGGCRKSSPPGLCCHMDNSTGVVHCH